MSERRLITKAHIKEHFPEAKLIVGLSSKEHIVLELPNSQYINLYSPNQFQYEDGLRSTKNPYYRKKVWENVGR